MSGGRWGIDGHNRPEFLDRLRAQGFSQAYAGGPFEAWRAGARAAFEGLLPRLPAGWAARAPAVICAVERDGLVLERLVLEGPWCPVPALVLRPAGPGPFPAVLLLHDHGSRFDIGKEKLVPAWDDAARLASGVEWAGRFYGGRFVGEALARKGFLVLCADALGWGEREGNGYEAQQALACTLMLAGASLAGVIAREDVAAAQALAARDDVRGVAALGFSLGGFRAWQVAALCETVAATVAVNWMATLEGVTRAGNNQLRGQSAFSMTHPGAAALFDYPDMAGLAAPRPLFVQAGAQDALFPPDSVETALARLRHLWRAAGAPAALATAIRPGGHQFGVEAQEESLAWLAAAMGP
ncbi:dienelactone hydrolase family protein [uncultured Alsobacter sp.]|uniref:dienelactone hydrolase family protein n=1 Tax=uncultured Alsobacter sp. TaxID=1748258 RepID=UPI0025DF14E1|nr:dienelactone hydrolase family protein [uncultured Alsobacter sp.]